MALSAGFKLVAQKLEEAATSLSLNNISTRLADELRDKFPNQYCYLVDVFGDDESGDVVYCLDGDIYRASYQMGSVAGKAASCEIDTENATDVVPRTTYEEEADEDDHMIAMESQKLYAAGTSRLPIYERFISKAERDKADAGDFAGKGKSFPILKPEDVSAAVHAMGRAGSDNHSPSVLKKKIIAIAKKKGFGKHLPQSWQTSDSKEKEASGGKDQSVADVVLAESAVFCQDIPLTEAAKADYLIKLIQPGWGTSGYYSREVLERDGPNIFPAGTHMFWNHATDAEEAGRPEGDLNALAAVTSGRAFWDANGKEGAGLYAHAKIFSDYSDRVAEKGPHTGLSIHARGKASMGEAEGRRGQIIEALTCGQSVDFVTKAGAGGKILTEAARSAEVTLNEGGDPPMDAAELKELKESIAALQADNKRLKERALIADASVPVNEYFASVTVPASIQQRVQRNLAERFIANGVPLKDGNIDKDAVRKLAESETRDLCNFLESVVPSGRVAGLGAPATDPKVARQQVEQAFDESMKDLSTLFCGEGDAKKSMRKAFREGRVQ